MLSDALIYSSELFYAANLHCLTLQKVVDLIAMEEHHKHSENFIGCTVIFAGVESLGEIYILSG